MIKKDLLLPLLHQPLVLLDSSARLLLWLLQLPLVLDQHVELKTVAWV
jgi:hypothetical protein